MRIATIYLARQTNYCIYFATVMFLLRNEQIEITHFERQTFFLMGYGFPKKRYILIRWSYIISHLNLCHFTRFPHYY